MNKKLNSVMMALVVIMCFSFTSVYADSASDKANIQQVKVQRRNLESKVEIMNSQLKTIMAKINKNETNITIAQKDIKQTKVNLVKAEVDIKAEQIIFDKRMRAMYMNGSASYIDIMLGADGIDDFISRLENIKTIVTFDQKAISDMKTKEASINLKKVALEKGNTKLLSLRADNKEDLAILTKQKSDQNLLALKLDALENKYGAQLVIDEAIVARQALAAKQVGKSVKAASTVLDSNIAIKNAAIKYTASDLDLLARLITAEAGGESYKAQVAVGAVVLNRVRSGSFPNSISAVINDKANGVYQFTPVLNGNINRTAQAGSMKAAIEALSGTDPTNNSMYFYSGSTPPGSPKSASIRIDHLTFLGM
ncbi:cell wall hydrolase [Clostridium estertheticum]|uniref:cell wall hydrolase n=1 Tax=Clostridium estertheticum TaxID=238834 RepID=UPI00217E8DF0|nr:cell wall hydrolase [Clostridium estertheticum]